MYVIRARNVNEALPAGIDLLVRQGNTQDSRNGQVRVFPTPVTTVIQRPTERVLCFPERKANHVFHLMEALWMLAGRNDVAWLTQFNKRMSKYSDNGVTFNAAYGHRWRQHFHRDQLTSLIALLKNCPNTRRAVLQIWDNYRDLYNNEDLYKDIPCNTQVYFWVSDGKLNMTVTTRSSDILWGLFGTNIVHFSILQEYLAAHLDVPVGTYWHVSNNFHAYVDVLEQHKAIAGHTPDPFRTVPRCWYARGEVEPFPLIVDPGKWDEELKVFMTHPGANFIEPFFERVAKPLYWSYTILKKKGSEERFRLARKLISSCPAADWREAVLMQIDSYEQAVLAKENQG